MPECSKCGKPVSGSLCPHCKTPLPAASIAKQADADFDIYEGFTQEEITIFNQYLRLVQSGWLEVAAVDRLGTDHHKELEEIKDIIKRGLKALQKAQERAQKEAEMKARQLAKDEKKNARLTARQARKQENKKPGNASPRSGKIPLWVWPVALIAIIVAVVLIFRPEDEPPPPPVESQPAQPAVIENYFLRQGRVACHQQEDLEKITRAANNRRQFEEMLQNGKCFINNDYIQVKDISQLGGSLRKGYIQGIGWIFFHNEALEKQIQ